MKVVAIGKLNNDLLNLLTEFDTNYSQEIDLENLFDPRNFINKHHIGDTGLAEIFLRKIKQEIQLSLKNNSSKK